MPLIDNNFQVLSFMKLAQGKFGRERQMKLAWLPTKFILGLKLMPKDFSKLLSLLHFKWNTRQSRQTIRPDFI